MALTQRCCTAETDDRIAATAAATAVRRVLPVTLTLRHGDRADSQVRYEVRGGEDLSPIIVAGGISAGQHVISSDSYPEPGWWEVQKAVLGDRRPLLAIDWLGADGEIDAPIDPADQAECIVRVLTALGIPRAAAFIGASYGAMVGMHLAARHPARIGALLAISASASPHPFSSACRSLQRQVIALGESASEGATGVALARAMAMLTYRTPEEFAERFTAIPLIEADRVRVAADSYLDAQGARHCRRMDSVAYRRLSESIDLHRVDPATIRVPLTLAGADRDALVPEADVKALAGAIPGARFHPIKSAYGHDAFLKEKKQVAAVIAQFLETLDHAE